MENATSPRFGASLRIPKLNWVFRGFYGHFYQAPPLLTVSGPLLQFVNNQNLGFVPLHGERDEEHQFGVTIPFYGWTIDNGPLVESNEEIWAEIAAALAKGKVETAAAALRHHLEYVSRHLADELGASPQFRSDGNYELGELMPAVLKRMKELYGKAADAAQSWGKAEGKEAAAARKTALSTCNAAKSVEEWAVNKAVHYNEWANFGKKDFEPVVAAFKELLSCFSCSTCGGWLYITPARGTPDSLRCPCNSLNINLKVKAKGATGAPG